MSQAQGFPEGHNEDAYLEYPHGFRLFFTLLLISTKDKIQENTAYKEFDRMLGKTGH
jgi:hypothetical protein